MTQNNEQNKYPYSEDGTFAETNFMESCDMDISPYLYEDDKVITNLGNDVIKVSRETNCDLDLKVSILNNFIKLQEQKNQLADNLNNLDRRIKRLIIEPNAGFPYSQSLKDSFRGRFQMLFQEYIENKPISKFNAFIVWDKGHYRPIFPIEVGIYDHMEEVYWGYKVQTTRKEDNISLILKSVYQSIRDGILHEFFSKLEKKCKGKKYKSKEFFKLVKNSISILNLWLEDMALIHNEECSDNRSGKLIHYRELRVCKYCLEVFNDKDEIEGKEKNIIPYDHLHRQQGASNTCKKKHYNFINSCFDIVGTAKLKLFSILGEFPSEIPVEWRDWWCHDFSAQEINSIKDRVVSEENPHKVFIEEVKQNCSKIADKILKRFSQSKLYDKLLDDSFYPYKDFETDEYLYEDENSRLDDPLRYHMDSKNTGKELNMAEIINEIKKSFHNLKKAQIYYLLRRPETLNTDEFIKEHRAKLKEEYPS